jgi:hypothetical protein
MLFKGWNYGINGWFEECIPAAWIQPSASMLEKYLVKKVAHQDV